MIKTSINEPALSKALSIPGTSATAEDDVPKGAWLSPSVHSILDSYQCQGTFRGIGSIRVVAYPDALMGGSG
jgi:hypothetical protein